MANMIKFYRGLVNNLPTTGENGALYITTDEGAIYYGTGTGMKRLGDFIQVDAVANLPADGANTSALYYCVAENILAKWNGTSWTQVNKQPTAEELKGLLGLGSLAYKSIVVESDLDSALAEKVNAAAEGNHSHSNKGVLDGITADKVSAWDAAEGNAKGYADGLNTAMNTRVEALEAIDHDHSNKALLDTYTQTEANLADAVAKKHSHTFVESELNKIVDGDVAKWNAVVADHLTSTDKTTLENAIKEAKKAGTDANTNIETYKVANDARVLAVEEDIAEITGENGILAQAKSYTDGKDSAMNTRVAALETAAPTHATKDELAGVDAKFANYNTTVAQKAIDDAQDAEIAKKVDKVDGKSLIADSEIARLATLHNYDDAQIREDIAKKADAEAMTTELGKKVDKVEGYSLVSDAEIARLADVDNYDDTVLAGRVTTAEGKITALETASATHALKTEVEAVDAKFADYVTSASYTTDKQGIDAAIADRYTKEEADGKFALIADAYDDTALSNRVKAIEDDYLVAADKTELAGLVTAEKERAEGIEGGLRTDVNTILGDYLKAADKTALQEQITANANAITALTDGIDPDKIDGLTDLVNWANEHAPEVESIKEDIEANAQAISGHEALAAETYETKTDAAQKLTDAKGYADGLNTAMDTRVKVLEGINHDAYIAADATLKSELQAEIDADVKVVNDALESYKTSNNAAVALKANAADVYAKTETYTKTEIEALLTWGEF